MTHVHYMSHPSKRVPLQEADVGPMHEDREMQRYMADLLANGRQRLDAARQSPETKEMAERLRHSLDTHTAVTDSPWSCSRSKSEERDHTPNKSLANKDTTVGTARDIAMLHHYRSKLSDIWVAAYTNELDEVSIYLDVGLSANLKNSLGGNGETPLHNAALGGHLEMIELLVQNGKADVNAIDDVGNTPLHMAARAGYFDAALRLLDFNAKGQVKNEALQTPWQVADKFGHTKLRDELPKPQNYSTRATNISPGPSAGTKRKSPKVKRRDSSKNN